MPECRPLYRETDWCIWRSIAFDAIPPGNCAGKCERSFINAMTGLFCIKAIIRDTARKFITTRLCPVGEFKMRETANLGLHGVRKDVRAISTFASASSFKWNLSIYKEHLFLNALECIAFCNLNVRFFDVNSEFFIRASSYCLIEPFYSRKSNIVLE